MIEKVAQRQMAPMKQLPYYLFICTWTKTGLSVNHGIFLKIGSNVQLQLKFVRRMLAYKLYYCKLWSRKMTN